MGYNDYVLSPPWRERGRLSFKSRNWDFLFLTPITLYLIKFLHFDQLTSVTGQGILDFNKGWSNYLSACLVVMGFVIMWFLVYRWYTGTGHTFLWYLDILKCSSRNRGDGLRMSRKVLECNIKLINCNIFVLIPLYPWINSVRVCVCMKWWHFFRMQWSTVLSPALWSTDAHTDDWQGSLQWLTCKTQWYKVSKRWIYACTRR